jgi:hypothetical protein
MKKKKLRIGTYHSTARFPNHEFPILKDKRKKIKKKNTSKKNQVKKEILFEMKKKVEIGAYCNTTEACFLI